MRVLACPDSFSGTLSAVEAAQAMRAGWLDAHPADTVECLPLSDGGPGFVRAIAAARGAQLVPVTVRGPLGDPVLAEYALLGDCAWVESAAACGLQWVPRDRRDPQVTTTYGVGELIAAAIDRGARLVTVGLGGSATNDGGAGALAALGARATGGVLDAGGTALADVTSIDLTVPERRLAGVDLVVATDVDNPLLGLRGASATFGPQKGADDAAVMRLDAALEHFAAVCGRRAGKDPAVALGSGAAGGLGYGLMRIGARRVAGIDTVLVELGLMARLPEADLVLTGEGCLDDQSLHGKVVPGLARACAAAGVPCVAVVGELRLGKRELAAAHIDGAYAVRDIAGANESMSRPSEALRAVVARVAQTWGRR